MRGFPDTITGRLMAVLLFGLLATAIATAIVLASGWSADERGERYPQLITRLVTLAQVINGAPPVTRDSLLLAASQSPYEYRWMATPPSAASNTESRFAQHLHKDLSRQLDRLGMTVLVRDLRPLDVWIGLQDDTWLHALSTTEAHSVGRELRWLLALLVFIGGVVALALWAARRVTRPLTQFTAAAERLGTDVNAPPLEERGPRELRRTAHAFNVMQTRIRRYLSDRTLMLAAMSHDLRTALTRLRLRAEHIADEQQRTKALADLDEMQTMVESALAYAREESEHETTTKLDLAALLQSLCADLADTRQPVSYHGPDHLVIRGRPSALRRALANLIDNAVRYGNEAAVSIEVRDGHALVHIDDRGPGIPAELRERVFAPFFRLESSRSRETGGVGLGLSIARGIAHHHGGDVDLVDRSDGGMRVSLRLPLTTAN